MTNGTRTGRRWRRGLLMAAGLIALGTLFLALLPIWFPWLLGPVLSKFHLRYERYERVQDGRFRLTRIDGRWGRTHLTVDRVEAGLPAAWLWRKLRPAAHPTPFATVSGWHLEVERGEPHSSPGSDVSTADVVQLVARIRSVLARELDSATLTNGTLTLPWTTFDLPHARWDSGQLQAEVHWAELSGPLTVTVTPAEVDALDVAVDWPTASVHFGGRLHPDGPAWNLTSTVQWQTNTAPLTARFGPAGWWPDVGSLRLENWPVPAAWLPTNLYAQARASLNLATVSNRFTAAVTGRAVPSTAGDDSGAPELTFEARGSGDPGQAAIEHLIVQGPWIHVALTNQVAVRREPLRITQAAELQISADLSRLAGASLTGRVEGVVTTLPIAGQRPTARFDLRGTGLHGKDLEVTRARIQGDLRWPELQLDVAEAELPDRSLATAAGRYDLEARVVRDGTWAFRGRLPRPYSDILPHENLLSRGTLSGPISRPAHTGDLTTERIRLPALQPLDLSLRWQGEHQSLRSFTLRAAAGTSTLALAGSASLTSTQPLLAQLRLDEATLREGQREIYGLRHPATASLQLPAATNSAGSRFQLQVDEFDWSVSNRTITVSVDLDWPSRGEVRSSVREADPQAWAAFVAVPFPPIQVHRLDTVARWSNGPVQLTASLDVTYRQTSSPPVRVTAAVQTADQLVLDAFTAETRGLPALTGRGRFPIRLHPSAGPGWLAIDRSAPLQFEAAMNPVPEFAVSLAGYGGLRILSPTVALTASGSLDRPRAGIRAEAGAIEWSGMTNNMLPSRLESLALRADLDDQRLRIERFTAKVEGQLVTIEGEYPARPELWQNWIESGRPPDPGRASGRLRVDRAPVAILARRLPALLAPEGDFRIDVAVQPGRKLEGLVTLTNAATRPLGKMPPLRDIGATVRLQGDTAVLEAFTGQLGGQPVRATGQLQIPANGSPTYDVRLQGSKLPLARSVEFLLRGDFDVSLKGQLDAAPTLSGEVLLADGLFVQHATALMLSRPERPSLRPPYFSVTNQPFADWKLDLNVRGTRFLRIRTPLFSGVGSANLKVRGHLANPVLTGDLRADSGRVLFPFGTLQLDQAHATFDGNDPRGPELLIHASGRNYRYDIRLDVNGPADGANVQFTATPPLNSEEILLMLTAGEIPKKETFFSTQARAGRLATFLGRDFITRFSGNESASERLIINSGENITEEGKTTYSLEYRLSDRWSLIGEYDRFSALNAAVKWRIYSR